MTETWIHIPTPGDHYSAVYGSAVITIVHEFARVHARRGGATQIIVALGTKTDRVSGETGAGAIIEAPFGASPSRRQRTFDGALGRIGGPRVFASRHYAAALEAIPTDFSGPIFVHNNPAALPIFKRARPKALVCLWLHNEVWRSYGDREVRRVVDDLDRVICVSDFIARDVKRRLGNSSALRAKVRLARSGVDTELFRPAPKINSLDSIPLISYIGRVVPEKGPHLLIEAAHQLRAQGAKFVIRVVGSRQFDPGESLTPYETQLRERAASLGETVEFVPAVDRARVVEEFQKADIFCAPALWQEPLGLTILEALSCGLPTVTTRRGGIPEVGGEAALYFEPDDPNALSETLARLLNDPNARALQSQKARAHAETMSWEKQYDELRAALL